MEQQEYTTLATVEPTHWWHGGMRAITASTLNRLYGPRRDLRILDAGCGTGGNMRFLQQYGDVVGLDLAAEALALNHAPSPLTRGSVLSLPFVDEHFDLVTSFDVLYHRQVPDEVVALREFHRVLRSGGWLLLRMPAYAFLYSKHDRAVHTRRRYTTAEVADIVTQAGFFVGQCTYINTLLFPLALMQRLLEKAVPTLEQQQSDLALPAPPINTLLRMPMLLESLWLQTGKSLPFGLSILCVAYSGKMEIIKTRNT